MNRYEKFFSDGSRMDRSKPNFQYATYVHRNMDVSRDKEVFFGGKNYIAWEFMTQGVRSAS
ncbi:MAG: hypothetical protein CO149_02870 [Nitrospirae bacterium CG_4_9_14_3_um_filter_51_5]|nr:MAG: hypothetical protein CO149_02870 [Nitrospirae bacterium CG_4_9_14_3_um_filter_51_5]